MIDAKFPHHHTSLSQASQTVFKVETQTTTEKQRGRVPFFALVTHQDIRAVYIYVQI